MRGRGPGRLRAALDRRLRCYSRSAANASSKAVTIHAYSDNPSAAAAALYLSACSLGTLAPTVSLLPLSVILSDFLRSSVLALAAATEVTHSIALASGMVLRPTIRANAALTALRSSAGSFFMISAVFLAFFTLKLAPFLSVRHSFSAPKSSELRPVSKHTDRVCSLHFLPGFPGRPGFLAMPGLSLSLFLLLSWSHPPSSGVGPFPWKTPDGVFHRPLPTPSGLSSRMDGAGARFLLRKE